MEGGNPLLILYRGGDNVARYVKQQFEPTELYKIGNTCKRFRKYILKMTARQVAERIGYSPNNIYSFENGYINNAIILLWYMSMGLTYDMLSRGVIRGED